MMYSRVFFIAALLVGIVLVPLLAWLLESGALFKGSAPADLLSALGRVTATTGLALIAASLVLGLKLRPLDQAAHGLNRQYAIHHLIAAAGFVLVVLHPILSALAALPYSALAAREVLFPPAPPVETLLGWAAWLLFSGVMVTTFFLRPPYRGWRIVHTLAWPAFFIAWAHGVALAAPGPLLGVPVSYGMLLLVALLAAGIRVWLLLASPYRHQYEVVGKQRLHVKIAEFSLKPLGAPLHFEAGQFAYVRLNDPRSDWKCNEYHPFTISSAPGDECLRFTIKALGDCSTHLLDFESGATARIHGPYGRFLPRLPAPRKQIWIGGGVGITPFLSAVRAMRGTAGGEVRLFYCEDSVAGAVFLDELQKAADATEGLHLYPILADRDGYLNGAMIARLAEGWENADVYLCGPAPMTEALTRDLKAAGFPAARLHTEEFAFL